MAIELSEKQIKDGWQIVKFGEIAKNIVERVTPKVGDEKTFIGLEHVVSGSLVVGSWGSDTLLKAQAFNIKRGDIIYPKRNTYLRRVAVAPHDCIGSADLIVIRPKKVSFFIPELLKFVMLSDAFHDFAIANSAGSLSKRTKWKLISEFEFPLPPIERQKEILEVLEKVEIVKAKTQDLIEKCRTSKRVFLSSYLKSLKEKKLASDVVLNDILAKEKNAIVDGPFGSNLKSIHYRNKGVPIIQSGFVTRNYFFADSYLYVEPEYFQKIKRSMVKPGDIVMAKIGEYCGKCAILPDNHEISVLAGNSLKITTNKEVCSNEFLKNFLHYYYDKTQFRGIKSETAQPALSLKALRKLKIILPDLVIQNKINSIVGCYEGLQAELIKKTKYSGAIQQSFFTEVCNELQ